MMRVIHFCNLKQNVDIKEALHLLEEVEKYLESKGCIERRTLKLLDARAGGNLVESAEYINESLWPGKAEAAAAFKEMPENTRDINSNFLNLIEIGKSVRYVDEG